MTDTPITPASDADIETWGVLAKRLARHSGTMVRSLGMGDPLIYNLIDDLDAARTAVPALIARLSFEFERGRKQGHIDLSLAASRLVAKQAVLAGDTAIEEWARPVIKAIRFLPANPQNTETT